MKIKVGVSNHHVHVTREALDNIATTTLENVINFFSKGEARDNEVCYHCPHMANCKKKRKEKFLSVGKSSSGYKSIVMDANAMKNFVISCLIWVGNTKMLTKLIKANYRKDFSQMISFLAIVILSATMLNIGLTILFGFSSDMDSKFKAMNAAEICIGFDYEADADDLHSVLSDIGRYLDSNENVVRYVRVDGSYITGEKEAEKDEYGRDTSLSEDLSGVYTPYEERDIDQLVFLSKSDEEFDNPIYISSYYSRNVFKNHCRVGDEIELYFGERAEVFQLAGIFESSLTYDFIYISSS